MPMPVEGPIFSLDIGQRCGFATAVAGAVPRSGAVLLKKPDQSRSIAFGNIIAWLCEEWEAERPGLVAKEAPLALQAFSKLGNAEATVRMTFGFHGLVEGLCQRFGIRCVEEHNQTIRKHFLGVARLGDRKATKNAVIKRCHLLKLMPSDCRDEDRADAISVHDWASANYGRRSVSIGKLFLFGEEPA